MLQDGDEDAYIDQNTGYIHGVGERPRSIMNSL